MIEIPPLPQVAASPTKFVEGINNLNDSAVALDLLTFEQAFESTHPTDSHFLTYTITPPGPFPRINKAALDSIRAAGAEVVATMIVLDYDNPKHRAWMPGEWDTFLTALADADMTWTLLYGTRGGARLVYVLDAPCPVDIVEGYHDAIVEKLNHTSFGAGRWDSSVSDWTRFFRLPFVVREGLPTGDPAQYITQPDNRLDLSTITPVVTRPRIIANYSVEAVTDPKPTPEQARELITFLNAAGKMTTTQFYRAARKQLQGRECFPCCFENATLAQEGARGSTMLSYVGSAVSLLYHTEGVTPAHIYALFFPAAELLIPAADTPDWTEMLWRVTCRNWSLEASKEGKPGPKPFDPNASPAALSTSELPAKELPPDVSNKIVEGMQSWCKRPELKDLEKRDDFINRHLLVSHANVVYLMGMDGRYETTPLQQFQIIAAVRCWALGELIDTLKMNSDGMYIDRKPVEIMNQYATIVQETHAVPQIEGSHIRDIDEAHARLIIPSYSRNPELDPTFDAGVEEWLYSLTGKDFDLVCKWIASALAFDEGATCAISLIGPRGAGKKLFVKGLSECLTAPKLASGEDIAGNYTYGLLNSPFLVINEGWPGWKGGGRHPADQFRSLVAGDPLMIQRKYLAPVSVSNPVRVIFTANNLDVVRMLTAGRDLSPDDRDALSQRLLHVPVNESASALLATKGGMSYTGAEGHRWIEGDAGQPSDHVVAKHFLWLYSRRRELGIAANSPGRFLVEGNATEEILFELRTQAGSSPLVIETMLKMLESPKTDWPGLHVLDDRIYALPSEILTFYRAAGSAIGGSKAMAVATVANALKGVAKKISDRPFMLAGREHMGAKRWIEIDPVQLQDVASHDGWSSDKVGKLVAKQNKPLAALSGVFNDLGGVKRLKGLG